MRRKEGGSVQSDHLTAGILQLRTVEREGSGSDLTFRQGPLGRVEEDVQVLEPGEFTKVELKIL